MPEPIEPPPIDEEALDDILYLCRTGETDELKSLLPTLSSQPSSSPASSSQILAAAVDSFSGNSTLHMAAANGHIETLKYLLETLGYTPQSSQEEAADGTRMGAHHPLLDRPNEAGNTPLHWAAVNGQLEAVKLLVSAGADTQRKNAKGHDAIFEAEAADREEVVAYLLSLEKEGEAEEGDAEDGGVDKEAASSSQDQGSAKVAEQALDGVEHGAMNGERMDTS